MSFKFVLIIIAIVTIDLLEKINQSQGLQIKDDKIFANGFKEIETTLGGLNHNFNFENYEISENYDSGEITVIDESFDLDYYEKAISKPSIRRSKVLKRSLESTEISITDGSGEMTAHDKAAEIAENNGSGEGSNDYDYWKNFINEIKNLTNIKNCTAELMTHHDQKCICQNNSNCLRFCSYDLLFSYNSHKNETENYVYNVRLKNNTIIGKNLIEDFDVIVRNLSGCEKGAILKWEKMDDMILYENGSILNTKDNHLYGQNDYCFEVNILENGSFEIDPMICHKPEHEEFVTSYNMAVSVPFFILTIVTYAVIPQLRSIHGKCFMSYLGSLTIVYATFAFLNLFLGPLDGKLPVYLCKILGHLIYHFTIAQLIWMCCISYDTWRSLTSLSDGSNSYLKYSIYGWGLPFISSLFVLIMQSMEINDKYKPGINGQMCCINTHQWSAMIYFYGPSIICYVFNSTLYILTLRFISSDRSKIAKLERPTSKLKYSRFIRYFRLSILMGLGWGIDIFTYLARMLWMLKEYTVLDYVFSLQGLGIFCLFVLRRRVRKLIVLRFRKKGNYRTHLVSRTMSSRADQVLNDTGRR